MICRRMEGPPYSAQPTADLSVCRVSDDPPYPHVRLDFAGTLYVKQDVHQSEKNTSKAYISRQAIHLQLTADLNV